MTDRSIQQFLSARGKTGVAQLDYVVARDGNTGPASFAAWDALKLGPAPTAVDITAIQRLDAQFMISHWPIEVRALLLTLLDQINVLRQALPVPLPTITPAQALTAVAAKGDLLS